VQPGGSSKPQSLQHLRYQSARLAYCILGMQAYLDWFPGDRAIQGTRNILANRYLTSMIEVNPRRGSVREESFLMRMQGCRKLLSW